MTQTDPSSPADSPTPTELAQPASPASDVVIALYEAINRRDVEGAMAYIDPDCAYYDLNFPKPFEGQAAVRQLFTESCDGIPADLQFVIDDITTGDPLSVGLMWHVELNGVVFPNSRGASFYKLSEHSGQIVYARDVVEPPLKLGAIAFILIRWVTPLVRRWRVPSQPPSLDPSDSVRPSLPRWVALVFWAIAILYTYILLLSPPGQLLPGDPAWAIQPETIREVIDESINFFLVLPVLNLLGITVMQAPVVHPTTEALFNIAEAWIFMFLPVLLLDPRGRSLPRVPLWAMAMFLTNVFLTPYMAVRSRYAISSQPAIISKGRLARVFGWIGLVVGTGAMIWGLWGRAEFGDWAMRSQYFLEQLTSSRVAIAFCVDLVLFGLWQFLLLGAIDPESRQTQWLRCIPFWGLALWLIL